MRQQTDNLILIHAMKDSPLWHVWYFYIYVAYTIIFFYTIILSFVMFGMFVCCCVSLCVISKVNAHCGYFPRRIFYYYSILFVFYYVLFNLLTRTRTPAYWTLFVIKKYIYIAPLTLNQVWVGLWHSLFSVPQNNSPTMRLNTPLF